MPPLPADLQEHGGAVARGQLDTAAAASVLVQELGHVPGKQDADCHDTVLAVFGPVAVLLDEGVLDCALLRPLTAALRGGGHFDQKVVDRPDQVALRTLRVRVGSVWGVQTGLDVVQVLKFVLEDRDIAGLAIPAELLQGEAEDHRWHGTGLQ